MSTILLIKNKVVRIHVSCKKCGDMSKAAAGPLTVAKEIQEFVSCDECEVLIEEV